MLSGTNIIKISIEIFLDMLTLRPRKTYKHVFKAFVFFFFFFLNFQAISFLFSKLGITSVDCTEKKLNFWRLNVLHSLLYKNTLYKNMEAQIG